MKEFFARQKIFWAFILSLSVLPLNGCVYLVVGSIGAFGGYVASPDTVEGTILDRNYLDVWNKAVEVVSIMGMIEETDDGGGMVTARIQGASVKVAIFRIGTDSVKISIKARKGVLPRIKIAQDVYMKVVNGLDVQRWDG